MFTPIKNRKVYQQVIEQITKMIAEGTIKRGDKLPSERELSLQLGVSRASVREALTGLEVIGIVESKQGEGNFIRESFEKSLFEPLSVVFMLNESKPGEILELRKLIEIETASVASENITKEDLNELEELILQMEASDDEDFRVKTDKEFHYKIAKAAGNFLILNILNTISILMDEFIKSAREEILKNYDNKNIINQQHHKIFSAIKEHNREMAAAAMKEHMELINENLIGLAKSC